MRSHLAQWNSVFRGLLAILSLTSGCTSQITNLTPSALPREKTGLYHFEAEWTSTQRSRELQQGDIRAYVLIDQKFYPMERVPKMTNRWETEAPIRPDQSPVYYYFKWDYGTAGFGRNHPNSVRSPQYRLEVGDSLK